MHRNRNLSFHCYYIIFTLCPGQVPLGLVEGSVICVLWPPSRVGLVRGAKVVGLYNKG